VSGGFNFQNDISEKWMLSLVFKKRQNLLSIGTELFFFFLLELA
jgi:hypothetical protein